MEEWIPVQARRKKWAPKTYTGNMCLIQNHILPHLGRKPIQKVVRKGIDMLYDLLSRTPRDAFKNGICIIQEKDYDNYEPKFTIKEIHDILNPFFRKAVECKMIRESPVPEEGPKKCDDYERAIWDEELMVQALNELENFPLLHLAIHCAYV